MDPLQTLLRALAETGAVVHQVYSHMDASILATGGPKLNEPPPPVALFMLLMDIIPDRLTEFEPIDFETAARLLDLIGEAIEQEIYLLPIEGAPEMN